MFRKTVREVLKGTGWDRLEMDNTSFHEFLEQYGNLTCKFPSTLKRRVTYYELHEKYRKGMQFIIFQNEKRVDFDSMDPFENAVCLVYAPNSDSTVEVFAYDQEPFKETILLKDLSFLASQFDHFNIFKMDGSRVENKYGVNNWNSSGFVAISKKSLSGSFRDDSEGTSIYIVMRYFCPTAQCILANRNRW